LLKPLYELQKERVRQGPVIWTDDTPVTVLGGDLGEAGAGHGVLPQGVMQLETTEGPQDSSLENRVVAQDY
jgi:hypothetical protein